MGGGESSKHDGNGRQSIYVTFPSEELKGRDYLEMEAELG
jgi:hypothetical protein